MFSVAYSASAGLAWHFSFHVSNAHPPRQTRPRHWVNRIDDLHDAPILYVSGNQALSFTGEEEAKLRQFVEEGGLIFGNADCANGNFTNGFKRLGNRLFPPYEFRELPANHLIFTNQWPRAKWKHPPSVLGLSNGARELMLLIPQADPSRVWQTRSIAGHEDAYQLLGNIFLYTVDKKDLRFKGETYVVRPDPAVTAQRNIKVARLQYAGNWDPEPAGWRQLGAFLHNRHRLDLATEPVRLGNANLAGSGCNVAHMTGTAAFKLDEPQRSDLKSFVAAGGTLLIDSSGGSAPFADSVETELDAIFAPPGSRAFKPLRDDHPVFAASGEKLEPIGYRRFAQLAVGHMKGPRLQGIEVNGRTAVFYSREDLSVGLVGQSVDGILRYDPPTAAKLTADILFFSMGKK